MNHKIITTGAGVAAGVFVGGIGLALAGAAASAHSTRQFFRGWTLPDDHGPKADPDPLPSTDWQKFHRIWDELSPEQRTLVIRSALYNAELAAERQAAR